MSNPTPNPPAPQGDDIKAIAIRILRMTGAIRGAFTDEQLADWGVVKDITSFINGAINGKTRELCESLKFCLRQLDYEDSREQDIDLLHRDSDGYKKASLLLKGDQP